MDETKKKALEEEFRNMMDSVHESHLMLADKEVSSDLLMSAYSNTNGDPPDVKVKNMAMTEWKLAKAVVRQTVLLVGVMKSIDENTATLSKIYNANSEQNPDKIPLIDKIFNFLVQVRVPLCCVLVTAAVSPYGVAMIDAVRRFFSKG